MLEANLKPLPLLTSIASQKSTCGKMFQCRECDMVQALVK